MYCINILYTHQAQYNLIVTEWYQQLWTLFGI